MMMKLHCRHVDTSAYKSTIRTAAVTAVKMLPANYAGLRKRDGSAYRKEPLPPSVASMEGPSISRKHLSYRLCKGWNSQMWSFLR